MRKTMAPYLAPNLDSTYKIAEITKMIFEHTSAVLPLGHNDDVSKHLRLAFADDSQQSTLEFLKLIVYLLSNKLLQKSGNKIIAYEILKWFQIGDNHKFCRAILDVKTPTIDAFAETIFCSAVENRAIAMIPMFLESGINPNTFVEHTDHSISHESSVHDAPTPWGPNKGCVWSHFNHTYSNLHSFTPLQYATITHDLKLAKLLLGHGADLEARDTRTTLETTVRYRAFPQTPLQIAARMGNEELVKVFISAGAVVNTHESFWSSALQNAAKACHSDTVQLLLDANADLNACFGHYGCPLACAIEEKCEPLITLLLANNANVNAVGQNGITSLQAASMVNDDAMVAFLLKHGANVNTPIPKYPQCHIPPKSALQWAVKNKNYTILSLLLDAGQNINQISLNPFYAPPSATTALEIAVQDSNHEMITFLLNAGADPSLDSSIAYAAKASDVGLVSTLLQEGADIDHVSGSDTESPNDYNTNALYHAVLENNLGMIRFLINQGADPNVNMRNTRSIIELATDLGDMEIIQVLIEAGADCNKASSYYHALNPLQTAVDMGNFELVEYFISVGADINWPAQGYCGATALQKAVQNGNVDMVEFLLGCGANVNAPSVDSGGVTALQAAVSRGRLDLVELLLRNGANANDRPSRGNGFSALQCAAKTGRNDIINLLVLSGATVNGPPADRRGLFAIQVAALHGHISTVEFFLEVGADINAPACPDGVGYTAFQAAMSKGHPDVVGYTALQAAISNGHLGVVKLLLHRGADVNAPGSKDVFSGGSCGTALTLAARNGYIRIAKNLLSRGANLVEQGAMPALHSAAEHGRVDMIKLLITEALKRSELNRDHLKVAFDAATHAGHTAAAKFLECHKVVVGNSSRSQIRERGEGQQRDPSRNQKALADTTFVVSM
jgi:ankyrin repeat protein